VNRDLGVILGAQLSMREHVSRTAQASFFYCVRCSRILSREVTIQLVVVLLFSRLDYCNAVLAGLPIITRYTPLQQVLRVAARLVNDLRPHDTILRRHSKNFIGCR